MHAQVEIDFEPFATTARLLYEASFVAERFSGIRDFLHKGAGGAPAGAAGGGLGCLGLGLGLGWGLLARLHTACQGRLHGEVPSARQARRCAAPARRW